MLIRQKKYHSEDGILNDQRIKCESLEVFIQSLNVERKDIFEEDETLRVFSLWL